MERAHCDEMDIQRLAAYMCGLDPESASADEVEESLQTSLFEMDESCLSTFHNIIEKLIPLIETGENPMADKVYKGFARRGKYGQRLWLANAEIDLRDEIYTSDEIDEDDDDDDGTNFDDV